MCLKTQYYYSWEKFKLKPQLEYWVQQHSTFLEGSSRMMTLPRLRQYNEILSQHIHVLRQHTHTLVNK